MDSVIHLLSTSSGRVGVGLGRMNFGCERKDTDDGGDDDDDDGRIEL
jgi:hypothetical protein